MVVFTRIGGYLPEMEVTRRESGDSSGVKTIIFGKMLYFGHFGQFC